MLDDFLKVYITKLTDVKCPKKVNQKDNLNYCKYHFLIRYPIEKCFV